MEIHWPLLLLQAAALQKKLGFSEENGDLMGYKGVRLHKGVWLQTLSAAI